MRHAEAELQLWLANDRLERAAHEADLLHHARAARTLVPIRARAGLAVIALGERLAGLPPRRSEASRPAAA